MSGKDGGWILPEVIDPMRVCVQLWIPNDFHHLAAFWGALYELTRWYNWQRDDNKTGKKVADVWYEIWRLANDRFYAGHGCSDMPQTLLRMDQQCGTLQVSYDDGAHWQDIVDIGSCITAGVQAGIQDAISQGQVAAPAQQPAAGQLQPQQCATYHITLRGNSRWNCPVPVRAGFTITTANARGATGDSGAITAVWGCPDGKNYFLGACGAPNATQPTDPLQSQPHLRLIGYCSGVYMDMYNATYIVPNGVPDSAFFLQVNDSNISDNQGELQVDVTVCNHETVVEYSFLNFQTHGFNLVGCAEVEASANGLRSLYYSGGPNFWNFRPYKTVQNATYLRTIELEYTLGVVGIRMNYHENCVLVTAITQQTGNPVIQTVTINRNLSVGQYIGIDHQGNLNNQTEAARLYLRRLKFTFNGPSAFND